MTNPIEYNQSNDREAWLIEAGDYISRDLLAPIAERYNLPLPPVRYSVGFGVGTRGAATKTLGMCIARSASADSHNEIFISPIVSDSATVLATLVHELIHAFLDNADGHKGRFRALAVAVGLEGKMTATNAGPELTETLAGYIDLLGPIPHAAIDLEIAHKPQKSRMIKVSCTECGFHFRASRTQIEAFTHNTCLVCAAEALQPEQ